MGWQLCDHRTENNSSTIHLYKFNKDDCSAINTNQKENEDDEKEIDDRSIDCNNGTSNEH